MALAGVILGAIGMILGVAGVATTASAAHKLDKAARCLDAIGFDLDTGANTADAARDERRRTDPFTTGAEVLKGYRGSVDSVAIAATRSLGSSPGAMNSPLSARAGRRGRRLGGGVPARRVPRAGASSRQSPRDRPAQRASDQ